MARYFRIWKERWISLSSYTSLDTTECTYSGVCIMRLWYKANNSLACHFITIFSIHCITKQRKYSLVPTIWTAPIRGRGDSCGVCSPLLRYLQERKMIGNVHKQHSYIYNWVDQITGQCATTALTSIHTLVRGGWQKGFDPQNRSWYTAVWN